MAKQFRYDYVAGPFDYWKDASNWVNGYNFAKGLKWTDKEALTHKLEHEMHDGHMKGFEKHLNFRGGFFVVKKIKLSEEERAEIDEKARQKKLKEAQKAAELALKRVAELQGF